MAKGLTDAQRNILRNQVSNTLDTLTKMDGRKRGFVLLIGTIEGNDTMVDAMFNIVKEDALTFCKEWAKRNNN